MKTFLAAFALAAALAAPAQDHQQHGAQRPHDKHEGHGHVGAGEKMTAAEALAAGGGRIRRGGAVPAAATVALADVLKEPAKYAGKAVIIEGVVERVCQKQGCWVQIAPGAGASEGVRVTFDHKFFVPKDADKMKFRAAGTFSVKYLSEDEATHLEKEGARLRRDKDGEATELNFTATGVELWK
jgi:hypothetical protein